MPDENKFEALRAAGFRVRPTCLRCKHSVGLEFTGGGSYWGVCDKIYYKHLKHTGDPRPASITVDGWCPQFELDPTKSAGLGAHVEFLENKEERGK